VTGFPIEVSFSVAFTSKPSDPISTGILGRCSVAYSTGQREVTPLETTCSYAMAEKSDEDYIVTACL
jgi:hypothetical protein